MSLAQGWGSAADLQMQVQGLQMENARLKEELAAAEKAIDAEIKMRNVFQCAFEEGREQLAAAQKDCADAQRYRWLRKEHDITNPLAAVCWKRNADRGESNWVNTINAENLDKAIDAAVAAEKGEKK